MRDSCVKVLQGAVWRHPAQMRDSCVKVLQGAVWRHAAWIV